MACPAAERWVPQMVGYLVDCLVAYLVDYWVDYLDQKKAEQLVHK
jgi:hypothetical protein